ncbi:ABC transporter permease [Ancylobacter sp. A5.8]|uniref:ABC transporter permease n=1 Tax=Ancylobacter gelatini TaxID=2919920 RepID=UPI001F4D9BF8|nr:ABC transporter permease [Ancylobacter gelatini]MCJ8143917.1 ABC transporter permease [Ancylobacter gelatini]
MSSSALRSGLVKLLQESLPLLLTALVCWFIVVATGNEEAFADHWEDITYLAREHVVITLQGFLPAAVAGLALGVLLSRPRLRRVAEPVIQLLNIGNTIPSLAVIALSMTVLGLGTPPVVLALCLVALLPIVRNTYVGLTTVPPDFLEAGAGMGMLPRQVLVQVELPWAFPAIMAGLRTGISLAVGTAPLAFLIGGGGLGQLIFSGIAVYEFGTILSGAIPVILLALLADLLIGLLAQLLTHPHTGT